jgi:DNA primase
MRIDLIKLFQELNIRYESEGRNISGGWIGVYDCPYCGDHSTHLGFNVETGNFHCFSCKAKGWLYDFLMRRFGASYDQVKTMCRGYWQKGGTGPLRAPAAHARTTTLPPGSTKDFTTPFSRYLEARNFGPEIIARYDLYSGGYNGPFQYRLVMPVYENDVLVNYLGRDITNQQEARYKNCPNELAAVSSKSCVYNLDQVMKNAIIVEGPTDVWRMGMGTICTLGTTYTNDQVRKIKKAGVEQAMLLFDPGDKAQTLAKDLASALNGVGIRTWVYSLDGGTDPGDFSDDKACAIRNEIFHFFA